MNTMPLRSACWAARSRLAAATIVALLVVCPASATAEVIPGDPLQVFMDASGDPQAQFQGSAVTELRQVEIPADRSGMNFITYNATSTAGRGCGPLSPGSVSPVSGPAPVTGSGTIVSPYELSMVYDCTPLRITQTFSYVDGDTFFTARYAVTNTSIEATKFRALSRGSFSAAGSGRGHGFFDATAPRLIGVFNDAQGSEGGFVEAIATPWSRFLVGPGRLYPSPFDGGESDVFGDGLDNTVDGALITDPRVAVQFDRYTTSGLAPSASDTFDVIWFFGRYDGLSLAPGSGTQPVGQTQSVTATSLNHGQPVSGGRVRYSIAGANPSSGSASTAPDGTATISWTGAQPGQDTLTAYIDSDDNGVYEAAVDTLQTATFTWTGQPPPPPAPPPPPPPASPEPPAPAQPGCPLTGHVIVGSARADNRTGTAATDIMFGLAGNDVLRGGSGRDCLYGQSGADRLHGGADGDRLFGGDGSDRLRGDAGDDDLRGGAGADVLSDSAGRDAFSGGSGNDEIDARDSKPGDRRRADDVRCGAGRRDLARADRRDRVAGDCERVRRRQ